MGIVNIIDQRKRTYRFNVINAVIEAAWHDNSIADADQAADKSGPSCEWRMHIPLAEAIAWGNSFAAPITLFIYDQDNDPMAASETIGNLGDAEDELADGRPASARPARALITLFSSPPRAMASRCRAS